MDALRQPVRVPFGHGLARGGVDDDARSVAVQQRRRPHRRCWRAAPAQAGCVAALAAQAARGRSHACRELATCTSRRPLAERTALPRRQSRQHRAAHRARAQQRHASRRGDRRARSRAWRRSSFHALGEVASPARPAAVLRRCRPPGRRRARCPPTGAADRRRCRPPRAPAADIAACVIVAGCATRLSTPPSDSASVKHSQSVEERAHRVDAAVAVRR